MVTSYATCCLCEAICGIAVEHENGHVLKIRGDERDPLSRGYVCPKAPALEDIRSDPDRLLRPMKREGDRWFEVSWKEAIDETCTRFAELQQKYGNDAVALYAGNPTLHSYSATLFGLPLVKLLKTRNLYTSNSVDSLPRIFASKLLYDSIAIIPVPDLERTDHWLIIGANPVVSNGSAMSAPDCRRRIKEIKERGGRVVVVDPRRNETAELAGEHHFIKPGTDALFLAALIHTVFEERLSDPGRLRHLARGFGDLERAVSRFTPERVARAAGMKSEEIRAIARDFARAKSAACYGRIGLCTQEFGTVSSWLADAFNVVTGNLDREGGAMFASPAIDLAKMARAFGQTGDHGRWVSRVSKKPEVNGEFPVGVLAEEIETEGEGKIHALMTLAGNPVLAVPNGKRLERALEELDFMVSIDLYRNETTRHANLILPTTFGLEHDHYPLAFHALGVRNGAKYSPPVLPRPAELPHDWELLLDIGLGVLGQKHALVRWLREPLRALIRAIGPRGFLKYGLLSGGSGISLTDLENRLEGIDLGPLEPRLPELLGGEEKRIELAPKMCLEDLSRLERRLEERERAPADELVLIGRRQLRNNNSWMHNSKKLSAGKSRCTLLMNPDDASARGLSHGDRVALSSRTGKIEADLEISAEVMRGVVSLPHGYGHHREGVQLSIAVERPGVSINDVTDDRLFDALSGTSSLNGVEVSVARAG